MAINRRELAEALLEVGELHPEWRMGQLVANVAGWAGENEPANVWDVSDEQLLAAAPARTLRADLPVFPARRDEMPVMPSKQFWLIALIPLAYLVGSIPFGLLVGLAKGIDVRKSGSGNIGATNVARLLGGRFFALVFTLDLLKGLLPVLAGGFLLNWSPADLKGYILWLVIGFAAIAGHMFSIFLKFKGGKGVATSTGVILGVFPYFTLAGLIAAGLAAAAFLVTRYVSVASLLGAICFPIVYVVIGLARGWGPFDRQLPLLIFGVLIAVMIIYKHRTNIVRLRAGTENRFGAKTGA